LNILPRVTIRKFQLPTLKASFIVGSICAKPVGIFSFMIRLYVERDVNGLALLVDYLHGPSGVQLLDEVLLHWATRTRADWLWDDASTGHMTRKLWPMDVGRGA
jgi:hypothetical protein